MLYTRCSYDMGLLPDTENCVLRMRRECWERFVPSQTSKETASWRSRNASRHVRRARAFMHVGIANPRWRWKRSRHSRHMSNPQCCVSSKRLMETLCTQFVNCAGNSPVESSHKGATTRSSGVFLGKRAHTSMHKRIDLHTNALTLAWVCIIILSFRAMFSASKHYSNMHINPKFIGAFSHSPIPDSMSCSAPLVLEISVAYAGNWWDVTCSPGHSYSCACVKGSKVSERWVTCFWRSIGMKSISESLFYCEKDAPLSWLCIPKASNSPGPLLVSGLH